MDEILQSVKMMLLEHLGDAQPLTVDAPQGATTVTVPDTSRFRSPGQTGEGGQVWLLSSALGQGEGAR